MPCGQRQGERAVSPPAGPLSEGLLSNGGNFAEYAPGGSRFTTSYNASRDYDGRIQAGGAVASVYTSPCVCLVNAWVKKLTRAIHVELVEFLAAVDLWRGKPASVKVNNKRYLVLQKRPFSLVLP